MGRKKPTAREDENPPAASHGGAKSKKKALVIDDDEYSIDTELSEEPQIQEEKVVITGKKKGKKGTTKTLLPKDDDEEKAVDVEEDTPEIVFAGKKKPKSKKGGSNRVFSTSNFGLLGEEEDNDEDDDKQSWLADEVSDEDEDAAVIAFSGKKKSSKRKNNSVFTTLSDDVGLESEVTDDVEQEQGTSNIETNDSEVDKVEEVAATLKNKKKKKKSGRTAQEEDDLDKILVELDEGPPVSKSSVDVEEDTPEIVFAGKKKSKSKKGGINSVFTTLSDEVGLGSEVTDDVEQEQGTSNIETNDSEVDKVEEVAATLKNKKKKKKSGRTAQEEDDLDKILVELGEAPSVSKPSVPPPEEDKPQVPTEPVAGTDALGEKEGDEGIVESAAAKKRKKKKEKEKEKKAAAATLVAEEEKLEEEKTEKAEPKKNLAKSKADSKVPKHIKEMQEAIARRKEAEERKKREEEEKLRKEEEERLRQEELERQAEEAKRRKKEREKEKLLKKKQEGKLLTGKQKEEARRLEAMRNQILANAGMALPTADKDGAPTKRPKYQTKKSKPVPQQANGVTSVKEDKNVELKEKHQDQQETLFEVDSTDKAEVEESINVEDRSEVADLAENGVEDDDDDDAEWDAKSWDDVNLNVKSSFADEEAESEPEPVTKKEIKSSLPAPRNAVDAKKLKDVEEKKNQLGIEVTDKTRLKDAAGKYKASSSDTQPKQGEENLRSPICCIMGHVDTGKTKLLDCIRGTNVQEGEAGGITQQIGATYFPAENIRERTKELKADAKLKVPGLLVIDTPGHESFTNLRSRGSGLCDIAILVVDIMHGLEQQTIESLNLLKMRNTEFIVALNKVDRLYGWKVCRNAPIGKALKLQSKDVKLELDRRLTGVITQFKEQGLNTELYYKNKEMGETFSIVPTSAISGEGVPDLLLLLVQWSQKTMVEKLTFSNEVQCTVLEVKVIEGHGTTIDVVLVNGVLHQGDQIVVCGLQGPIVTSIRALLTPHPMKELRVKGTYLHHKEIKAAQGIKITAQGLEHAIAGTGLYVVGPDDDLEDVKEAAMEDMKSVMSRIDKSGEGVCVQASTLGSLEALLEFLKTPEVSIPVSGISIGPVHKKDVMKASVMLEKKKEYATILAFDVKVTPEARELADELGVRIFIADIIYHLFDQFKAYIENLKEENKKAAADDAVFPCVLKILPTCIFNKKDPIVLGVDVLEGIAKVGTPICIPQRDFIDIGRIASIENNHKPVDYAKKGQQVAIKIVGTNPEEQQKMFGRHFELDDELVSHISRQSIDVLKANYRDDLSNEEWRLVVKLKNLFKIP